MLYGPEAQGSLPRAITHCTYRVRLPAPGVTYVPRTVAPQVGGGGEACTEAVMEAGGAVVAVAAVRTHLRYGTEDSNPGLYSRPRAVLLLNV